MILQADRANAPVLTNVAGFIALLRDHQQRGRPHLGLDHQAVPSPFGSGQFLGQKLINKHQAGMIGVTLVMLVLLLYLFFRFTRIGLAMRAAAANPESARLVGIRVGWMTRSAGAWRPRSARSPAC